jgi:hypothetical protein
VGRPEGFGWNHRYRQVNVDKHLAVGAQAQQNVRDKPKVRADETSTLMKIILTATESALADAWDARLGPTACARQFLASAITSRRTMRSTTF